jgi:hypothetical protein
LLAPAVGTEFTSDEKQTDVTNISSTRFWPNYSPDRDAGPAAQTPIYFIGQTQRYEIAAATTPESGCQESASGRTAMKSGKLARLFSYKCT